MAKKKSFKGKQAGKSFQRKSQLRTSGGGSGYRFLNPYNFVRFLGKGREDSSDPEVTLLGRCAPPPHDRYVGITGKITCTLETVTPLFISDSEGVCEEPNDHKSYRFFQVNNQHAIPATALRGMVRTVFEAVTNSCFSTVEDSQLDYRLDARRAPSLRPAVVTKVPNTAEQEDGEVLLLKAAWMHRSVIEQAANSVLAGHLRDAPWPEEDPFNSYFDKVLEDQNLPIQARVRENVTHRSSSFGGKSYAFPFNEATEIVAVGSQQQALQQPDGDKFWGYLKITGPNVIAERPSGMLELRKHDERFFYWDGSHEQKARIPWQDVVNRENAEERYNKVRAAQKSPANQQLPYVTYLQNENLSVGDLVWVSLEKDAQNNNVVADIGSVSIPKLRYKHGILDLLPEHLHPCQEFNQLCPACRVFGWVHQQAPEDPSVRVAYGGRVAFSQGILQGELKKINESIPLAILSSPKPTTTPFYLLGANDQPSFEVNYDTSGARLRGRKFYRHHGTAELEEYRRAGNKKDGQNRTVRDALDKDNKFIFTVHFENLAPVELGALLWALELEEGWVHRLGFAKPLGFGSVRVSVNTVEVLNPRERYASLTTNGWYNVERKLWQQQCVEKFKTAMQRRYNKVFDELKNVQDLKALLGTAPTMAVHYPRPPFNKTPRPDPEGKQYEWFIGNKRTKKLALKLAPDDTEGLPLIDKHGNEF
jgi:CRISPR-associated protein (TIGR03986 family)